MAFELSQSKWKLGFTIGFGQKPRIRTIKARDLAALQDEIKAAKKCFGLPEDAPVLSCYEAGREGFWIHRYLQSNGIESLIMDSSSIEVNRKAKRAKTDKLDARKLLMMLMRYDHGEERVWSVVNAPSPEAEDHRHLHRELDALEGRADAAYQPDQGTYGWTGYRHRHHGRFPCTARHNPLVEWFPLAARIAESDWSANIRV